MYPNIERLRASARRLKKAFAAGDIEAIERLRTIVPEPKAPKHADFLHVVARECGFESWPKLKTAAETAQMNREQKAKRLERALYFGQTWVVEALLAGDPSLAQENFGLEVALYDRGAVAARLAQSSVAATEKIGGRAPILHLAYSRYIHMEPDKRDDMLAIAALLVANGADVNDGYPPEQGSEHWISVLYGALDHADNLVLAEWLLDHGANPDDNESLYHATELGHHDGLKLLIEHGASTRGTNALPRALDFDDVEAVRMLLDHGADPNEAVAGHPSGQPVDTIPALHQAARRWCSAEIGRLLLDHGADPRAVWNDHTPFAIARIYGNAAIADVLSARGDATPLSSNEAVLATCASGGTARTRLDLGVLNREDRRLMTRIAARPGSLDHIRALVAVGLDPDQADEMGLTPLHVAGWEGLPDHVAYLLTLRPDLAYRNDYGGDALSTVIHGSEFCPRAEIRDHVSCARLLLEAGARLDPREVEECGNEQMVMFLQDWSDMTTPGSG